MASESLTASDYIKHHLTNLTFGQHPDGHWGFAHSAEEASAMGFWAIHVDTMFWSIALGALFLLLLRRVARKASADTPGGMQNFVEWIVDFVNGIVKGGFTGHNPMVAPMALTIFIWVFLINFMDLIPVDWLPQVVTMLGSGLFGMEKGRAQCRRLSRKMGTP